MKRMHSHQEIQDDSIAAFADKGVSVEDGVLKAPIVEQKYPSTVHSYTILPPGPIYITPYCIPKVAVTIINGVFHIDVDVMLGNHSEEDYTNTIRLFFQGGLDEWEKKLRRMDHTPIGTTDSSVPIACFAGVQDDKPIAAVLKSEVRNQLSLDVTITIAGSETASVVSVHGTIPLI